MATKFPIIPILEAGSRLTAGSFTAGRACSTRDALSDDEERALGQIRELQQEARGIKKSLKLAEGVERQRLENRLAQLRQEAKGWREVQDRANAEKHIRLGHGGDHSSC